MQADADVVETERLRLRRFAASDVDVLVELDSDPQVMHFITGGVVTSRAEIESAVLPAFMEYHRRVPPYGFWAAEERSSGSFVGWFHLRPAPDAPHDEPELGYRLVRNAWGRGLASEGASALVDLAFTVAGARRVVAETMAVHVASRRVMERAGMRLVRNFQAEWPYAIEGDEHGDVEYAIDRVTWQAAHDGRGNVGPPRQ